MQRGSPADTSQAPECLAGSDHGTRRHVDLLEIETLPQRVRERVQAEAVIAFQGPRSEIESILENIARIERHVAGSEGETFLHDEKTRDAVERCRQRISEAVAPS